MSRNPKMWLMGIWKFRDKVGLEELYGVAAEFARDVRYIEIYIRSVSKDQIGIGFTYDYMPENVFVLGAKAKQAKDDYFEETSDFLKRRFGNDFVGWDTASPVHVIMVSPRLCQEGGEIPAKYNE